MSPLVALEVTAALRAAGARVLTAGYLETRLFTTNNPELSAAVIDLQLGDGNGTAICRRLRHLGVPFVVHTGYPPMLIRGECRDVPVISKPARPEQIISALIGFLHSTGNHRSSRVRRGSSFNHNWSAPDFVVKICCCRARTLSVAKALRWMRA